MTQHKKKYYQKKTVLELMNATTADSLTGFIAGFLVGVIGMYVYAIIVSNIT
ncbi:MAG: hypothetical protein AAB490_00795 [Patescibacteria group bacterium]